MSAWDHHDLDREEWVRLPLFARISLAYAPYSVGWRYDAKSPRVAFPSPGVPSSLVSALGRGTDCSTMATSILTACYPDAGWTMDDYRDLQSWADPPRAKDSPVQAIERRGVGQEVAGWLEHRWHAVQGWRSSGSGHLFLVLAKASGGVEPYLWVVEASSRGGIGPRWRQGTPSQLRREYDAGLHIAALVER